MERKNERRRFLKQLFSLSAFVAGSSLSLNRGKGSGIGDIGRTEAWGMGKSGKKFKKISVEAGKATETGIRVVPAQDFLERSDWSAYVG